MNKVDIAVVALLFWFAFRGYSRGLFHELMSVATMVAGAAAGFQWTPKLAARIASSVEAPFFVTTGLAFVILFLLTVTTLRYFLLMVERMWVSVGSSPFNRVAGGVFGIFKGALVLGCTVLFLRGLTPEAMASEGPPGGITSTLSAKVSGPVQKVNGRIESSVLAARLADLTGGFFSALMDTAAVQIRSLTADSERG